MPEIKLLSHKNTLILPAISDEGGGLGGVVVRVLTFNLYGRRFQISTQALCVGKLVVTCRCLMVYSAET